MHGCILSTVATDGLVLKHQAFSIHSADKIFIIPDQFYTEILHSEGMTLENKNEWIWKKNTQLSKS